MSHASYIDEEKELKVGKAEYFSAFIVSFTLLFSYINGYLTPSIITLLISSLMLTLYRKSQLLRAYKQLKEKGEYLVENKYSTQVKEGNRLKIIFPIILLSPFVALYIFPVPENLFIALAFVMAYPFSNLLIPILVFGIQKKLNGEIYSIMEIVDIKEEDSFYIKKYGYKLKRYSL